MMCFRKDVSVQELLSFDANNYFKERQNQQGQVSGRGACFCQPAQPFASDKDMPSFAGQLALRPVSPSFSSHLV